jgi:hypothetical protein
MFDSFGPIRRPGEAGTSGRGPMLAETHARLPLAILQYQQDAYSARIMHNL